MSLSRKSLGNLLSSLVLYPLSIVVSIFVAVELGPDLKGVFSYVLMLRSVFIPIAFLGIGTGLHYFLSKGEYTIRRVALSSYVVAGFLGIQIAVLLHYAFHFRLLGNINDDLSDPALHLLLFIIPLQSMALIGRDLLRGVSNYKAWNVARIVSALAYAVVAFTALKVLDWGLMGALYAMVTETVLLFCIVGGYSLYRGYLAWGVDFDFLRPTFNYGIKTMGGTLSSSINDRFDYFVLGYFVNSEILGIYSVGYSLVKLVTIIPTAIAPVMINRIAGERDRDKQLNTLLQVHAPLFVLSVAVMLGILGAGYFGIPWLYGEAYAGAFPVLLILSVGILPFAITRRMIDKYFNGVDKPLYPSIVQTGGAVVAVIANLVLVPIYGIGGAAWATTLSWLAATVIGLYLLQRHAPGAIGRLLRPRVADLDWAVRRVRGALPF